MNRFEYGKVVNGNIEYPPAEFHENGMSIVGFTEDFILQHGYKNIVQSDPPNDEKEYIQVYTETKDAITVTWK